MTFSAWPLRDVKITQALLRFAAIQTPNSEGLTFDTLLLDRLKSIERVLCIYFSLAGGKEQSRDICNRSQKLIGYNCCFGIPSHLTSLHVKAAFSRRETSYNLAQATCEETFVTSISEHRQCRERAISMLSISVWNL
ncbi:hypothetical protein E4T56_gene4982 [Termitomyces sp. T112]|nr:hypothetical protein E4T56_gene4982 [Termitomyces sp. T112]